MRLFFRRLVGIWSYLAASAAALALAGGFAWAANLPLLSGPAIQEPSQELNSLNTLIQNINAGVSGLIGFQSGPISSLATTIQTPFVSTTIPTGQLASAGQGIRVTCGGITGANTDTKAALLSVGTATVSTGNFTIPSTNWNLELLWSAATNPVTANYVWTARAFASAAAATSGAIQLVVNGGNDTAVGDNIALNGVPVKCSYVQGTSAVDMTLENFTIEQVK